METKTVKIAQYYMHCISINAKVYLAGQSWISVPISEPTMHPKRLSQSHLIKPPCFSIRISSGSGRLSPLP